MVHKTRVEIELGVPSRAVWNVFTKEMVELFPRLMPKIFASIDVLEGDGTVGTIFLFNFAAGLQGSHESITYQKEKVVEMNEEKQIRALEVIEGGYRTMGFSYYRTRFEMKDKGESSCVIDFSVEYETINGQPAITLTTDSAMVVFKAVEAYLLYPPPS